MRPVPCPTLVEWPERRRYDYHTGARKVVGGSKGRNPSVRLVSPHSGAHALPRAAPEWFITFDAHSDSRLLSPTQTGTEWMAKDGHWHQAPQTIAGPPHWGCSVGKRDPLRSKVLSAHLALGRVGADTHAPASLPPRHTTMCDNSRLPAPYHPKCQVHRKTKLEHTACWT